MDAFRQPEAPEALLLGADGSGSGLRGLLVASGLNELDAMEFVSVLTQPGAMTAALNWYRAMDPRAVDGLPQIVVPTLSVWSTGDAFFGRSAAEGSAEFVTGPYTFVALEGVNHWIPESAPAEVSRLLLDHLSTT
jgi:pimeloyl-ACP methyl ester carboxylesterase